MAIPPANLKSLTPQAINGHATANENFAWLSFFAAPNVISAADDQAEPGSPSEGDAYWLGGTPTGTNWAGNGGNLALYYNGSWLFLAPKEGMRIFNNAADEEICYSDIEDEWYPTRIRWSTTEHWTGRYNGTASATNKIYAKVVTLGTLPTASNTANNAHSITNLDRDNPIITHAYVSDGAGAQIPVPSSISAGQVGMAINGTNVQIWSEINISSYTGECYMEYQKTA